MAFFFSMSKLHFAVFDKSVGLNHWCAVTFTEGQAEMMSYMLIWKCWWSQHLFSLPVLLNQTWQEPCSLSISIALLAKEMIFYWMLVEGISKREFIISACLLANASSVSTQQANGSWSQKQRKQSRRTLVLNLQTTRKSCLFPCSVHC